MDINKLEIDSTQKTLPTALGFTDEEGMDYLKRVIVPIRKRDFDVAEEVGKIYNNSKEPFGLRVLGLVALGRVMGERDVKGMMGAMQLPDPKEILKIIEFLEKREKENDD